jgi:peroxiredoxin Q/BCP
MTQSTLKPGAKAPGFVLQADDGSSISLRDLSGKKVVLYFYPKDDTPGCTTEACEFRDSWKAVEQAGAVVLGVSPDSDVSHRKFRAKYSLPFRLLSDPDHAVAESYGAWGEKSLYGRRYRGMLRTTFLIDGNGKVVRVFEKVKTKGHAAEVLAALGES